MDEEVIDYLYKWALSDGFKRSKEDFVNLLQKDDEVLSYAFEFAQKEGYKKDKTHFAGLVGRTTTTAPVAKTEPTKTEPAKTEPAKTEVATTAATTTPAKTEPAVTVAAETAPAKTVVVAETKTEPAKELSNKQSETIKVRSIPQREVEMPVADTNKMPPMTVKEAEPEVKEEPKKEMPIGENLLPVTEKTEVKAVETPSDKMVIKSEKKEEPVKVPSYKGIDKNLDIAGGVFIDKSNISEGLDAKDLSPKEILDNDLLGKNWHTIELNRNVSSRYPDPPNVNTKNLKSYNQDENFNVFKPIDIDGKKFYSNYDKKNNKWYLYEEGSNKDNWTEVKADPIKSMLSSKYLKYGQPIKESRDYSESDYNEIESAKKKLSYSKYLQYLVSNVNDLSPEEKSKVKEILGDKNNDKMYRWISYNVEDPKIADFWVNALEKLDIQSSYLDDIKKRRDDLTQQPQGTMQVKEVTEQSKAEVKVEEPKMEVKEVTKEEPKLKIKLKEVNTVPADVIEGKGLFVSEDLKGIKLPKYKPEEIIDKKLLTENKEALGLKQFEDRDLILKKWLESKGMPLDTKEENLNSIDRPEYEKYKYNQENNRTRAIVDSYLPYLIENKDKLSSEYQEKLREELTSPTFKVFVQGFRHTFNNYDKNNPNFKLIEKVNEEYWRDPTIYDHVKSQYGIQDGEKQKVNANEFLQSPILNNSEKVITKFGPMFYDKENDTYYKYEYGILNAEPYIKYQLKKYPDYKVPLEVIKPGTEQHKLIKEGNKETWDGVDRTMYRGKPVKYNK